MRLIYHVTLNKGKGVWGFWVGGGKTGGGEEIVISKDGLVLRTGLSWVLRVMS